MPTLSLEFMLDYRTSFIEALSRHYPIPTPWLSRYADVWDWYQLSQNTELEWDEALLDEHIDRWDWSRERSLSCNPALPWSARLIRKYVDLGKWDWMDLARQPKVFESAEMVELCLPHWSAADEPYSEFEHTPWGGDADQWAPSVVASSPGLRWDWFSAVEKFPWSAEFIEAHADELDWHRLSLNDGLRSNIDFIRRFEDRWDWAWTARVPWSLELLEAFEHRIVWKNLCMSDRIPWTEAWLDRFAEKLSWAKYEPRASERRVDGLLNHPGVRWTASLFIRHRPNIEAQFRRLAEHYWKATELTERYWTYHCDTSNWSLEFVELLLHLERTGEIDRPTIDWERLCQRASGIWTPEFVDAHRDRIDWIALASNPNFPWTERLDDLADQLPEWTWEVLLRNVNFVPTASMLLRYEDRWNWQALSLHTRASVETLVTVADRLYIDVLAHNQHLERRAVVELRDRWSPQQWQLHSQREFVSFADAEIELPWSWDILIQRAGAELCAQIDDATVQEFLTALVEDRQTPARNLELESAIARDLEQRDNYEVYADWLFERGDPHALLIRSMLEPSEPFDIDEFGVQKLEPVVRDPTTPASVYERFLEIDGRAVVWRRGFIRAAWGQGEDWRRIVGLRASRFLEALEFAPYVHPPLDDAALELLRPLDQLVKLSVHESRIFEPAALAHLPRLTDLDLSRSTLTALSPLAALQQLRSLNIWNTLVEDLGPIAELPNLRSLAIGQGPIHDLSPLRACRSLVALDIRFTPVSNLSPLHELTSLRRIFVDRGGSLDEDEIHALREASPALEFCEYEEFWRYRGRFGPFVRVSDVE